VYYVRRREALDVGRVSGFRGAFFLSVFGFRRYSNINIKRKVSFMNYSFYSYEFRKDSFDRFPPYSCYPTNKTGLERSP
jgi:hypothetical protein